MGRHDAMTIDFEEVTIFDKPALFTPLRINRSTIPSSYYLYEVRHDDDCQGDAVQLVANAKGAFAARHASRIARSIIVNHWGSLITQYEINLPVGGYLDIEPGELNYGVGEYRSMKEAIVKWKNIL